MSELGRELGVSQSAMTQIADRLEAADMASRLTNGEDRRVKQLQLTPRGRRAMRSRERIRIARLERAFEKLSAADRRQAAASLRKLHDACETLID